MKDFWGVKSKGKLGNLKFEGARYSNPLIKPISKKTKKVVDVFKLKSPMKDKDMNWAQAKWKYPKLKSMGDKDRDGVKNMFDCKPLDKRKQGLYHLPMTKKKYRRAISNRFPSILKSNEGKTIDVVGRKGITTYKRIREEKFADVKKEYPNEGYTPESILEMERGNATRVLGKGQTGDKIILQHIPRKYQKKYGENRRIIIVDKKTGDNEAYEEEYSVTAKDFEKEKLKDGYNKKEAKYNEYIEEDVLKEMDSHQEHFNKPEYEKINEKRRSLRKDSWKDSIERDYPEEKTIEALQSIEQEVEIEPESEVEVEEQDEEDE